MVQFIIFFKFYIIFFFLVVNYLLEQIFKAFSRLIVGALGSLLCFTQKHPTPLFSLLISESLLFSVFLKVNFPSITTPTPLQRPRNPYTIHMSIKTSILCTRASKLTQTHSTFPPLPLSPPASLHTVKSLLSNSTSLHKFFSGFSLNRTKNYPLDSFFPSIFQREVCASIQRSSGQSRDVILNEMDMDTGRVTPSQAPRYITGTRGAADCPDPCHLCSSRGLLRFVLPRTQSAQDWIIFFRNSVLAASRSPL